MRWLTGIALALAVSLAQAQIEKRDVHIAVGGKSALYYLPLTITERLGYFKDEGLTVRISDFAGGTRSLEAVVGGSADVVSGAYEHTINMQARKLHFQAFVLAGACPQISVGLASSKAAGYKSPRDLKGLKVGISAPGSSTNMVINYLAAKGGLRPSDFSVIGVGAGSTVIAAMEQGKVDALSQTDPVMTMLEKEGKIRIIAETRTPEGTEKIFGGPMPAASLYAPVAFIRKNPNTVQALTNAMVRALIWMQGASPQQILSTVPEEYLLGNKAMYLFAFNNVKTAYSKDGLFSEAGAKTTLKALASFNPAIKPANINLAETYTNEFAKKALAKYGKRK
ncbi:MAG TPA: ABC transporter substrate-binding protein [Burkholderiales bacterium]|jgi:NitT/TauT family transport system substrate-binding protein|nr:ABC transporter substrate-binding protein [Burkholderiales bacterium]HTM61294.1 ABC transporter substrate-binding protein [Burkholderiales bacterium]